MLMFMPLTFLFSICNAASIVNTRQTKPILRSWIVSLPAFNVLLAMRKSRALRNNSISKVIQQGTWLFLRKIRWGKLKGLFNNAFEREMIWEFHRGWQTFNYLHCLLFFFFFLVSAINWILIARMILDYTEGNTKEI
jgi:hypothetical protein